jgi:hypothetical protein
MEILKYELLDILEILCQAESANIHDTYEFLDTAMLMLKDLVDKVSANDD